MLANEQRVQGGQADENVRTVIAGDNILVGVERRKYASADHIRLHHATLSKIELIALTRAVYLRPVDECRVLVELLAGTVGTRAANRARSSDR